MQTTPAQIAAKIEPGFSGKRQIGPWLLTCGPVRKKAVPLPFSFGPGKSGAAAVVGGQGLGRCRTFIAFRRKADPRQIVLLLNFRMLGQNQRLAAFIRIPPNAKKGEVVTIKIGQKALNLPISVCEKRNCLAAGSLLPKQEALLYSWPAAELLLPPGPHGKRLATRVPLSGLRAAVGAMRRAQAGE